MPFSYNQFYKDQAPEDTPPSGNVLHKQETEERIYHKRGIGIPLKAPIVVGIEINPKLRTSKTLLKLAKDMNIPVTNMKSFKEPPPPPPPPPKMKGNLLVDVTDIIGVQRSDTKEIEIWANVKSWTSYSAELDGGRKWLPIEFGFKSKEEADMRAEQLKSDPAEFAKLKDRLKKVPLDAGR